MFKLQLTLEGSTMADIRRFVELTKDVDGDAGIYQPDTSVDCPAVLVAEIE